MTLTCSLGLLADRAPCAISTQNVTGPLFLSETNRLGAADRSPSLTATNQTLASDRLDDISVPPDIEDVPEDTIFFECFKLSF